MYSTGMRTTTQPTQRRPRGRRAEPKPPTAGITVTPEDEGWARKVATGVARYCGHPPGTAEHEDLTQVALLHLYRLAAKFDPSLVPADGDPNGQFRGWSHIFIRAEVLREARRMRGGGTYRTPSGNAHRKVVVCGLPTRATEDGFAEVEIADYRQDREHYRARERWSPTCLTSDDEELS